MSWNAKRSQVTEQLNQLALTYSNPNSFSVEQLQEAKQKYNQIRQDLTAYLAEQAQNYQLSDRLEQTGQLQGHIRRLEADKEKLKTDVDTALARDELLRSRERTGNEHTLYLLNRPVRRAMIPYLWALSVLFVGVGIYFFYILSPVLFPSSSVYGNAYASTVGGIGFALTDVFTNRYTWMALFGAASIVILALFLKIAGVFGK